MPFEICCKKPLDDQRMKAIVLLYLLLFRNIQNHKPHR